MKNRKTKRVFFDYASITPVDKKVATEMIRVQNKFWANPSSLHEEGAMAKNILEDARTRIAKILHCRSSEVFFTSGGTESLNLAILGIIKSQGRTFGAGAFQGSSLALPHIITSTIEHPAVLEPIKNLLKEGKIEVSFVMPNEKGFINPESIKKEIKENTVLIAIQHANNEIGVIQPVRKIREVIEDFRKDLSLRLSPLGRGWGGVPYLLVDASQSALYEDVSIERLGADMLVLDGIKIYGPRGMGVLIVKHNIKISPIVFGGGQESGLRSGTENVSGAIGLALALEIASKKRQTESKRLSELRNYAVNKILKEIPDSSLNGDLENRLPNNINICFAKNVDKSQGRTFGTGAFQGPSLAFQNFGSQGSPLKNFAPKGDPLRNFDSEFLVIKLDTLGFAVSAASACHVLTLENGSYVIENLGKKECAASSLRITFGRATKKSDLDKFVAALKKITYAK